MWSDDNYINGFFMQMLLYLQLRINISEVYRGDFETYICTTCNTEKLKKFFIPTKGPLYINIFNN